MTIDIFGPGAATPYAVTSRPADGRTNGGVDTWFRDCTAAGAGDGTRVPAAWLNVIGAQLSRAIRAASIPEDPSDDLMLWKAMQAAAAAPGAALPTAGRGLVVSGTTWNVQPGALVATAARTLTGADYGRLIEITATSSVTVTLATPVDIPGVGHVVYNAAAVAHTLATSIGALIGPGRSPASTMSLPAQSVAWLVSDGANWIVAAVTSTVSTGPVLIQEIDCTGRSTIVVPGLSGYRHLLIEGRGLSNTANMGMQFSTDNGVSWDETAANYNVFGAHADMAASGSTNPGITVAYTSSNVCGFDLGLANAFECEVREFNQPAHAWMSASLMSITEPNQPYARIVKGSHAGTTARNALRLVALSGMTGGSVRIYGE